MLAEVLHSRTLSVEDTRHPSGHQVQILLCNRFLLHNLLSGFPRTKISVRSSSGISVSFAPWNLGITSCSHHCLAFVYLLFEAGSISNLVEGWVSICSTENRIAVESAHRDDRHGDAGKIHRGRLTAWPRLSGWMSRKAKTFSLSKILKEGISPAAIRRLVLAGEGDRDRSNGGSRVLSPVMEEKTYPWWFCRRCKRRKTWWVWFSSFCIG